MQPVGLPLERGQVVELGRLLGFVLALHGFDDGGLVKAGVLQLFGFGPVGQPVACGGKAVQGDGHIVKGRRPESCDSGLTLSEHRQRRGLHPANMERLPIQDGDQARGVDAHQPIGLGAAQRRLIQVVVCSAVFQVLKALGYGACLHRGNPKALYRLFAVAMCVHKTKNKLALAPGVGGADDALHILSSHEAPQDFKLLFFAFGDNILPAVRQDGQILPPPLGVFFIVNVGGSQLHQMPHAPRNEKTAALQIAVLALLRAEYGGDGLRHAGLFRNYKSHFSTSFRLGVIIRSR